MAADRLPDLFGARNSKLGAGVFTFSLPAVETCPGRTTRCSSGVCYATHYRFKSEHVVNAQARAYAAASRPDFAARALAELRRRNPAVVRVHVSGDLFSPDYARAWLAVMRALPAVRFFLFTRSWRVKGYRPILRRMSRLPNVRVWYSLDAETGVPRLVPPGVRLAYMALSAEDQPPPEADLAFLDYPLRKKGVKRLGGVLVCPAESVGGVTCDKCRLCLDPLERRDPRRYKQEPAPGGRVPLPVLAG